MRRALALLLSGLLALAAFPAEAAFERLEIAGLHVAAWIPAGSVPGPWPVLVFSHGLHGCSTQSKFLMEALAQAGYAVFAPDHRDAACRDWRQLLTGAAEPLGQPARWSEATYADRRDDIARLLTALAADPRFRAPPFDWQRVGLVGHSLGGYTVLGIAGAWPGWKDARVKAVLALSPYASPFLSAQSLGGIAVPTMYQTGTRDFGVAPFVVRPGRAFDRTPKPKYLVDFTRAGHLAWTDLNSTYQAEIVRYSLAFLDHTLKGKPFPPALATAHQGVAEVRVLE